MTMRETRMSAARAIERDPDESDEEMSAWKTDDDRIN